MTDDATHDTPPTPAKLAVALAAVRREMAAALAGAGRPADATTLVAVSKTQPVTALEAALAAGQRVFGENRVQESTAKWPALRARHPDLELHLIGPLQTNKAREAVALFDVIETVDRPKLVHALAAELPRAPRPLRCYVEINTGEEPQKAGIAPNDLAELLALAADCKLPVTGLMCIPPQDEDSALHFALLADLARRHRLPEISMGMSGDYPLAIRFGATHVRVGTAIFGSRTLSPP